LPSRLVLRCQEVVGAKYYNGPGNVRANLSYV